MVMELDIPYLVWVNTAYCGWCV